MKFNRRVGREEVTSEGPGVLEKEDFVDVIKVLLVSIRHGRVKKLSMILITSETDVFVQSVKWLKTNSELVWFVLSVLLKSV